MPDSGQHKNKKARSFVVEEQRNPSGDDNALRDFGLSLGRSPSPAWPRIQRLETASLMHELGKTVLSMPWKK